MSAAGRFDAFRAVAGRHGRVGDRLLDALAEKRADAAGPPEAWSPGVAERLDLPHASGLGPASYFADLAAPHGPRHVRVCTGTACFAACGGRHLGEVERELGVTADGVSADGAVSLQAVRCLGYCYTGPTALDGAEPCTGPGLADQLAGRAVPRAPGIPAVDATGDPVLLGGVLAGEPGWQAWPQALAARTPDEIRAEVEMSGLRGRGGAGFLVAAKWAAAGGRPGAVVVANGDEGDPGSFADRLLMEEGPDRVLEGLALACFACGAREGVVLVRSEYPRALTRMREAVECAYADGHLGVRVHGSAVTLDVRVVAGAGSYVAGEETALIAGLEGGRGCSRSRPPYPTEKGLWDAPTVVNNVETLAAVPWIVAHGGAAYARRGVPEQTGTKLVCLSERFARPGCYEVEFGTRLERVVSELGGGLRDGAELAVVQVGGPLGGFLPADGLDVPLTERDLTARGAALGHAGLVAFDDSVEPREVLRHLWVFADAESCGACSPCRVGSRRGLRLAATGGPPDPGYGRWMRVMEEASLCAFGRRIPPAVRSLARAYGDRLASWEA
ncbi:NAD(P)H-dependent oxidoreductase subunit E [Streptomyces sp. CoH27]|uniref:NAD(P)H-dependent oxidoreductase subunit E n=1 Tax=Streptomyces sp. CoH27 TaxID=2875763 RepID=UPI001CD52CDB|nr:NAD(P)H-dependent oxidoreductase subunit E [Streptomyces sp. CoH27]